MKPDARGAIYQTMVSTTPSYWLGAAHPSTSRACGPGPAGRGRLSRIPVAGNRRDHHMEGVGCGAPMCDRIGQWLDDLEQCEDRIGPAVCDDDRQGVLVFRAGMNEVN